MVTKRSISVRKASAEKFKVYIIEVNQTIILPHSCLEFLNLEFSRMGMEKPVNLLSLTTASRHHAAPAV